MATATPQTKVLETVKIDKQLTAKKLADKIGRPLGSPINGYNVGDEFEVELTGEIQIREFQGRKNAYFITKQGVSIAVNASFDPLEHKEGSKHKCICREMVTADRTIKFAAFAN